MSAYELLHAAKDYFEAEEELAKALESAVNSPGYYCQHLYQARTNAEMAFEKALDSHIDTRVAALAAKGKPTDG
jgi:hypothetical protein